MTLPPGAKLGRYEIRSKIGEGGMGEVYLAQDTKLDRKVALKILPAEVAAQQDRMRRFVQEAKAASALNHPNIVTIYEIEQMDSVNFIAIEFIDGETLRQRMTDAPIKLGEVLDVAAQIVSALSAAHAVGIVHRDIKPENVMLRRDGIVKVLDFGLAKLTQAGAPALDTQAVTKPLVQTEPGRVMGTVAYMSPEQLRGLELDARTDIWSLGVVLYEMLAGQSPFAGETSSHIGFSILEKEPAPITRHAPQAPVELQRIVRKMLAKPRDDRYQTARDLLIDLKNLRRELDLQSEIERSLAATGEPPPASGIQAAPETKTDSLSHATGIAELRPTTSAEYLISEIKRHKTGAILLVTALVVVVVAALLGLYKLVVQKSSEQKTQSSTTGQNMKIQRLTGDGKVESAAISPDGKYVAYVVKDGAQQSLWMRLVATNSRTQIAAPADVTYGDPTFSPDGTYIYYVATDKNNPTGALYQAPVLGGATRKILINIGSPISFSPDGNRFAFVRNDIGASGEDQLMIANADGTDQRKLAARSADNWFGYGGPAWSPDGKVIACGGGTYSGGWRWLVIAVEAETGKQKELTTQRWFRVGRVAWLTDGSGLVVTAADQGSTFYQLWQLSYPRGEVRRITNDLNDYAGISLTADSKASVAVQGDWTSNIWIAPSGDLNRAKQIIFGKLEGSVPDLFGITLGLAWTPNGKIVYTSMASGNLDLWIMNQDGTEQKQLTTDPTVDWMPAVSPDGRYIVFISHRAGFPNLWRMDLDGGNVKQLTEKEEDYGPRISPDGHSIVYFSFRSGKPALWKLPIDGGAPVQLTDKLTSGYDVSHDGKLIAALYREEQPDSPWRIMVIPFEGGAAIKTFDVPPIVDFGSLLWTPDGRAITYIDTRGTPNLWSQPYEGGPPKQLTDFKTSGVWQCAWSLDGKWLALARGTVTKDVVLVKDFR